MSDITEEEWQRIRWHFGDLAYEHPEMRRTMLEILDMRDPDAAVVKATQNLRADFAEGLAVRIGLAELDRGDSVAVENTIAKAKAILDRAPDGPVDPWDDIKEQAANDRHRRA